MEVSFLSLFLFSFEYFCTLFFFVTSYAFKEELCFKNILI